MKKFNVKESAKIFVFWFVIMLSVCLLIDLISYLMDKGTNIISSFVIAGIIAMYFVALDYFYKPKKD